MHQSTRAGRNPRPEKVEAVLAAARKLFLTYGFSNTTTDMVQKESGVSKATLYNCYGTKESLFAAVIEQECKVFREVFTEILPETKSLEKGLYSMGRAYLDVLVTPDTLAFYRVMVSEASRFPELASNFLDIGPRTTHALFTDFIHSHYNTLTNEQADRFGAMFMSLLRGEMHTRCLLLINYRPSAKELDDHAVYAVQMVMRNIEALSRSSDLS